MGAASPKDLFHQHLAARGLRRTPQRDAVLKEFLRQRRHCSAEELYDSLRRKRQRVGYSTVYRTLQLLADCGLAREVQFEDGITRFERLYGQDHHDHLVCLKCGRLIEFSDPTIERVQDEVATQHDFEPQHHRMEIYGLCNRCR